MVERQLFVQSLEHEGGWIEETHSPETREDGRNYLNRNLQVVRMGVEETMYKKYQKYYILPEWKEEGEGIKCEKHKKDEILPL